MLQRDIVALALLREDMEDDRLRALLGEFERLDQQRKIMAIDGAEITQAELLKDEAAAETTAALGIG